MSSTISSVYSGSSCLGLLTILDEPEEGEEVHLLAFKRLLDLVDTCWIEFGKYLNVLESFTTPTSTFPDKSLACFVLSKVYFHFGDFDKTVRFALMCYNSEYMDFGNELDFVFYDTLISCCIDKFISFGAEEGTALFQLITKLFNKCLQNQKYKQALGISLECENIVMIKKCFTKYPPLLHYVLNKIFQGNIYVFRSVSFKQKLLRLIVECAEDPWLTCENIFSLVDCLLYLNEVDRLSEIINNLLSVGKERDILTVYQIGFDLNEKASQNFKNNLIKKLNENEIVKSLVQILQGKVTIHYHVDFLYRRNKTDLNILNKMKESFERDSILHNAVVTANSFMHCGTTADTFLRNNLKWLGLASNWEKFSATASIGVIHKGQFKDSFKILKPYLPKLINSSQTGPGVGIYAEGGALYALGIIHSNHCTIEVTDVFKKVLDSTTSTHHIVQHGACLGMGLVAMATNDDNIYGQLDLIMKLDSAVSGEAAAVGIGMVMLGSGDEEKLQMLLEYAKETPHEKIIRGIAISMALINYGKEQKADQMIEILKSDDDPILRYGAMYMIGLAYCGTAYNKAIKILLEVAVSDVSDDVRRAAAINLGFLLYNSPPKQITRLVNLLADSFNPHVRYGVTLALGVACCGTGDVEALGIIETLVQDGHDFVRQGAFIGSSMILIQHNKYSTTCGEQVEKYRKLYETTWGLGKRKDQMTFMGAMLANGIVDSGGRNVTLTPTKDGHNKMRNIIGLSMFTQYWFWYPYLHLLCLAMEPTAIIGLDAQLKMPRYRFKSNKNPKLFGYPEPIIIEETERRTIGPLAILTGRRRRNRRRRLSGYLFGTPFSPQSIFSKELERKNQKRLEEQKVADAKKKEKSKSKKEPKFEILDNPARVTLAQTKYITFDVDQNLYKPIKDQVCTGIVMLQRVAKDDIVEFVPLTNKAEDMKEPGAPKPFRVE